MNHRGLIALVLFSPFGNLLNAITAVELAELLKQPEVAEVIGQQIMNLKETAADSISDNFLVAKNNYLEGLHSFGLAASRWTRDCSVHFSELGKTLAKHYLIFGGLLTGTILFCVYVLPHVKIKVSYQNDDCQRVSAVAPVVRCERH